jgi:hypothetical protein
MQAATDADVGRCFLNTQSFGHAAFGAGITVTRAAGVLAARLVRCETAASPIRLRSRQAEAALPRTLCGRQYLDYFALGSVNAAR